MIQQISNYTAHGLHPIIGFSRVNSMPLGFTEGLMDFTQHLACIDLKFAEQ